jgi:hypothetical protein
MKLKIGKKFVYIDDEDYEVIKNYNWKIKNGYVVAEIFMHRLIVNAPKGKITDHINRKSLDNRKNNLRVCTKSDDAHNKKGISGVRFFKNCIDKKWCAVIKKNGIRHYGLFRKTKREAVVDYKLLSKHHYKFWNGHAI